ncbi:MAG TPA: pyridoxamine 5'-phosphate oxidase family protein [Candidatus Eisenbacteria bacterium]|nr:pyridoxamine 5'-phosphate oxidase family protein [Candidatus Eisenbacteria bacterium]
MWSVALATVCVLALAAVGGAASFPPDVVEALKTSKNLYVATKRKDGTQSSVAPIWFMFDGDAVYFTTAPGTHKATRIEHGSPVLVWVGAENGPHFVGKGEIVHDPAIADKMAPVYDQKYWISWMGFFRPRADRVREGKTLIVKVTPAE